MRALAVPRRLLAAALLSVVACSPRVAPDGTPDGVVRLWLERMEASTDDPRVSQEAFALLGPAARSNLEERARRTSLLTGRRFSPSEMMAPGWFGLSFRPKRMKVTALGDLGNGHDRTTVEVFGSDEAVDHAVVKCVKEGDRYRIEPDLPDPLVVPRRDAP